MIIVLDTNVLVSGILSPYGPPAAILSVLLSGRARLQFDQRIISEYRSVLARSKFGFDADKVAELLWYLEATGERTLAAPLQLTLPDPSDAMCIEVAMTGRAQFLVTGNVKHFPKSAIKGCRVATPREFLSELD